MLSAIFKSKNLQQTESAMSNPDYPADDGQSDEDIAAEIAATNAGEARPADGFPPDNARPEAGADEQGFAGEQPDRADEAQAEIAGLKDQILRIAADLENTRRRAEREKSDAARYAIAKFAGDLLSVADNFERALAAAPDENVDPTREAVSGLVTGLRMTDSSLRSILQNHGVNQINPKGEKFDPNLHQAVAQAPSDVPAGHIVEVAQTGFTIGDRVLRAAMVIVSTGGGDATPTDGNDQGPSSAEPGAHIDTQA